ncbi:MAG: hypothetical protein Q9222_007163 [Ikaeria aurantiellina]
MSAGSASNLWNQALDALSVEDQQSISADRSKNNNAAILSDILAIAEKKRQTCMQRRWKYTKKNGEIIILRDICDKIVKWVTKFKDIGDIAVQYDPAHASLPWAALRFCLQVSVNDVQTFGAMAESLELMARHITRCQLYEKLYLNHPSVTHLELEEALLRLYTAILTYLVRARHYYSKSTLRRLGASIIVTAEAIEGCLADVVVKFNELERCTRLVERNFALDVSSAQDTNHHTLKSLLASLEQPVLRTASQISDVYASLQSDERRKFLSWLSTIRYREHHKTAFSTVMPGSGQWLQRKPAFIDWKTSSSSSILWIHGIPGSGKSKLISTVVQDLIKDKAQQMATSAVAYFYCSRDTAETTRADPDEIMRAIIKQLACFDASQPVHAAVAREYEKRKRDADVDGLEPLKLSLNDCKDLVLEIAGQLPAIILIDALDECNPLKRHELLKALRDVVRDSASLIKVIVSSRDDADIVCRLANVPNVYISSGDNHDDVNRFIEAELEKAIIEQRLLQGRVPDYLRSLILQELKGRANGMFLWASLQIQNLCDPQRMIMASDVEAALVHLPTTLSRMYDTVLDRISKIAPHGRTMAYSTLRWLLCARRPLRLYRLAEMIGQSGDQISEEDILSLCCNLVVLDENFEVFRFAHASVREFLEVQPGFTFEEINGQAAHECLQLVMKSNVRYPLSSFQNYAMKNWIIHYCALDFGYRTKHEISTTVKSFLHQGVQHDSLYTNWARHFTWHIRTSGLEETASNLEETASDLEETTSVLEETGIPENIEIREIRPLHLACKFGLVEIFDNLAEFSDIQINERDHSGATSLYLAASNGQESIVELLLEAGASTAIQTMDQETALHRAAEAGNKAMVQLLLDHQANVAIHDDQGWTALDWATKSGHEDVARLLISHGSRDEAIRKYGQSLIGTTSTSEFLKCIHRPTGCIGIRNEGATGYLNAILHLLYTLQPFHDLLKSIATDDAVSIATALERLFTSMETSTDVVSTKDVIRAFDWNSEELHQFNDPIETYNTLMAHFHDILQVTPLFATYQDLLWSQILDLGSHKNCTDNFSYVSVPVIGNRDLDSAMEQWAADNNASSPRFGLTRWRYQHVAPILMIELDRFQYDWETKSIIKASHLGSKHQEPVY